MWDGKRWLLRVRKVRRPGRCPVHQCRHEQRRSQGKQWDLRATEGICDKCRKRVSRMNDPIRARYNNIKGRARRVGHQFTISLDHLTQLFVESSWYSEMWIQCFMPLSERLTIDRIDHELGYVPGNIQLMRGHQNAYKGFLEKYNRDFNEDPF